METCSQALEATRLDNNLTMDIWNIHTRNSTTLLLLRTDENKFRVVQQGDHVTLLTNFDYLLIDKKYKNILDRLSNQLTQKPVTIIDPVRQLKWDNFIEIKILNEIQHGRTDQIDGLGFRIWKYSNEYIFVSIDLKEEFEKVSANDFDFSIGFSYFAGTLTGSR